jgi:predicted HNH restriction endonuclease
MKTGISIGQRRLDDASGFIRRQVLQSHPVLSGTSIIRSPQGTVFRLDRVEADALETVWNAGAGQSEDASNGDMEGNLRLRQHYARERNRAIIESRRRQFAAANGGRVFCELCGFSFAEHYPQHLAGGFIEVHHIEPLASRAVARRTLLTELMLVCSNCHRMIHRTSDAEGNLEVLRNHFAASLSTRRAASRSSPSGPTR